MMGAGRRPLFRINVTLMRLDRLNVTFKRNDVKRAGSPAGRGGVWGRPPTSRAGSTSCAVLASLHGWSASSAHNVGPHLLRTPPVGSPTTSIPRSIPHQRDV